MKVMKEVGGIQILEDIELEGIVGGTKSAKKKVVVKKKVVAKKKIAASGLRGSGPELI